MDRDYGHILEIRRAERRRTVKAITALKADTTVDPLTKVPTGPQPECNYSEALLPLNKTAPSAPMYEGKGSTITDDPDHRPLRLPSDPGNIGPQPRHPATIAQYLVDI